MRTVNAHDFFDGDWCVAVQRAIAEVENSDCTIKFEAGEYEFFPEKAYREFSCIANHSDDGVRPFAFPLIGCRNLVISGELGTSFLFNGCMVPFFLKSCQNIRLEGFSIDWRVPFYSQGVVLQVDDSAFDIELCSGYEGSVIDGHLMLRGQPFWGAAEMDVENQRMLAGKTLNFQEDYPERLPVEELKPGVFRIHGKLRQPPDAGSLMVLRHGRRDTPAIFMDTSDKVAISNVTVFQAGGMGVIAQSCRDLNLSNFAVRVKPGSKRLFSACADAVHMVNCAGDIVIEDSLFENQFDDAINIHGVYSVVSEWISPSTVKSRLAHDAQKGLCLGSAGDRMRFTAQGSLMPADEAVVKRVEPLDLEYSIVEFDRVLQVAGRPGLALENLDLRPDSVEIRNCIARNNNPRGFLISTGGKVLIERNTISVPGAAIRISGDAGSWFESGPVESVEIKHNLFEYCTYDTKGTSDAVIDIVPEIDEFVDGFYYHKDIIITENTFKDCCSKIIYGWSAEKLLVERNRIMGAAADSLFDIKHIGTLSLDSNEINN